MDENDAKKGFAGLDSLASDVSKGVDKKGDKPANTERESKVPTGRKSSSTVTSSKHNVSASGYPGTGPVTASSRGKGQKKPSGFPGWAVFLGMLGVLAVIYWAYESSHSSVDDYRSLSTSPDYKGSSYTNAPATVSGKAVSGGVAQATALKGRADPLDRQGICELQELLGELGHYNSTVDGLSGPGTRRAISALLSDFPTTDSFEPTTRVLKYARSEVSRNKSGVIPTTAKVNLPQGGQILSRRSRGEAPFKISTSSGVNYYVKLVDTPGGNTAMTFFVRGGQTEELSVPYGTYSLRYASGKTWYGTTCLFGRNTTFFEADRTLKFYRSGAQIVGHRVELIRQIHGNMDANKISAGRF